MNEITNSQAIADIVIQDTVYWSDYILICLPLILVVVCGLVLVLGRKKKTDACNLLIVITVLAITLELFSLFMRFSSLLMEYTAVPAAVYSQLVIPAVAQLLWRFAWGVLACGMVCACALGLRRSYASSGNKN